MAGIWEGDQGIDVSRQKSFSTRSTFRERVILDPLGPVKNGPQILYGLRYSTMVWRLDEGDPFHEEVGYWLWDRDREQVLRCFIVPRGVVVNAGGTVKEDSKFFRLFARAGSGTYGILTNKFLNERGMTQNYRLEVTIHDNDHFSYREDTELWIPSGQYTFHHLDQNSLKRVDGH